MEPKRQNLELYYKFVRRCSLCKGRYGSDSTTDRSHICPICDQRTLGKGTIFNDTYHKAGLRASNVLAGKVIHTQESAGGKAYE